MKRPFVHEKLKGDITRKVKNGELKPGTRIFSISALGKKYGISSKSVRKALEELKAGNILSTHQGKGIFVAKAKNSNKFRNKIIGVITPDIRISFHAEIVAAIEKEAYKKGYQIVIGNIVQNAEKEENYLKEFSAQGVDGTIVITGMNSIYNKYLPEFIKHMPVVIVDIAIDEVKADLVTTDDISGAYEAVCHLIGLGHRKIAFLAGPPGVSTAQQRLEGYKKALFKHGIPFDRNLVKATDYFEEAGYRAMCDLLEKEEKTTAVFAVNDVVALGAMKAIYDSGLKIPEDISVVGYGCLKLMLDIPLTSVLQPAYQMGKIAFRNLLEKMEGERNMTDIKEVVLPTKLFVRKSSGRCNSNKKTLKEKETMLVYQNRQRKEVV